jgi:hypothetical protein
MAYDNTTQSTSVPTQAPNPVLEALGGALKQQQEAVNKAAELVNKTPQYTNSSSGQPAMPVPKPSLFGNASEKNVANQQPQTRAGARNKAIGQIAGMAGSVVGAYMKKKEGEKTQALAIDIHKSLELQQGMDEAKQVLAQDPNNAQAKATLQKNQTLMTALLNGKSGKDIAKAYGVTFGEEAKDMSPDKQKDSMHHQAMQQAMKQADQDKRMKEFEAQTPSRMQANPAYAAAQAQYKDTAKAANDALKVYTTMYDSIRKDQSADNRTQVEAQSRERVANIDDKSRRDVETARAKSAYDVERMRASAEIQRTREEGQNRIKAIHELKSVNDQPKAQKMAEDWLKNVNDNISKVDKQLTDLAAKQANPKLREAGESDDIIAARIKDLNKARTDLGTQKDQAAMEMHSDPDAGAMYNLYDALKPDSKNPL